MNIQSQEQATGIRRFFPISLWLPRYQSQWLRTDIIAGLTVMALLGTSRPPSVSVTSTIPMQSATVLASVVLDGEG